MEFQLPYGITAEDVRDRNTYFTSLIDGPSGGPDDEVVFYECISYRGKSRYLVWRCENGVRAVVGEDQTDRDTVLEILEKEMGRSETPYDALSRRARDLPSEISSDPMFQMELETEPRNGEDNKEIYAKHVMGFLGDVLSSGMTSDEKLSLLDEAVETCLSCRDYDASYASDLITGNSNIVEPLFSDVTPRGLSSMLTKRKSADGHLWTSDYLYNAPQPALVSAFADLSELTDLSTQELGLTDAVLSAIEDMDGLAGILVGDLPYYEASETVRREGRRRHMELVRSMMGRFADIPDIGKHEREAALLARDMGIPDSEDFFIRSFIAEPNAKRYLDAKEAHPDADWDAVLDEALNGLDDPQPRDLVFFASYGKADRVVPLLTKEYVGSHLGEDIGTMVLLADTLASNGRRNAALALAERIVIEGMEANEPDTVLAMQLIDREFTDLAMPFADRIKSLYPRRNRVWSEYAKNGGGIFEGKD